MSAYEEGYTDGLLDCFSAERWHDPMAALVYREGYEAGWRARGVAHIHQVQTASSEIITIGPPTKSKPPTWGTW